MVSPTQQVNCIDRESPWHTLQTVGRMSCKQRVGANLLSDRGAVLMQLRVQGREFLQRAVLCVEHAGILGVACCAVHHIQPRVLRVARLASKGRRAARSDSHKPSAPPTVTPAVPFTTRCSSAVQSSTTKLFRLGWSSCSMTSYFSSEYDNIRKHITSGLLQYGSPNVQCGKYLYHKGLKA